MESENDEAQLVAFTEATITCDWCGLPTSLIRLVLLRGGFLCQHCVHTLPEGELRRIVVGGGCDS